MTEHEMFEEKFPVPSETVWSDHLSAYVQKNRRVLSAYDDLWQVWQAARATPALPQGVEEWAASRKDYDRNIHSNPDAKAWADFFMETFPNCGADHGTILGWFANAMMAMHDHLLSGMALVPVELLHDIETDLIMEITNIGRLQALRAIIEDKP